ncbi:MAG TPA: hypothetical protein VHE60_04165 [Pyrinomonadaceae bacterium]|nr:hypothetical protein [Pyrinomonadaceae bacterium]
MDWFFNEWVYGTEMPSYRFDYQLSDGGTTLTGKITQSSVSDKFKMLVPVYIDSGKGWVKIGAAMMTGNTSVDLNGVKLPQAANRAAICALDDILALSVQNSKLEADNWIALTSTLHQPRGSSGSRQDEIFLNPDARL